MSRSTVSKPFKIKPLRAIIIIELDRLFVCIIISGAQNRLYIHKVYHQTKYLKLGTRHQFI